MPQIKLGQVPHQRLLLPEVLECVFTDVQLVLGRVRLGVRRVVPRVHLKSAKLNHLGVVNGKRESSAANVVGSGKFTGFWS